MRPIAKSVATMDEKIVTHLIKGAGLPAAWNKNPLTSLCFQKK